jgi:hypothetical protein
MGCRGQIEVTGNKKAAIRFSPMAAIKGVRGKLEVATRTLPINATAMPRREAHYPSGSNHLLNPKIRK